MDSLYPIAITLKLWEKSVPVTMIINLYDKNDIKVQRKSSLAWFDQGSGLSFLALVLDTRMVSPCLHSPGRASLSCRCVGNLKLTPQGEAPG